MEIHENIYSVLPDGNPGTGMSSTIAKMNEAVRKQSVVAQKGKNQKQIKKQQQQLQADAFQSRRPPPPFKSESQRKSTQTEQMHRSGRGRARGRGDRGRGRGRGVGRSGYGENGYSEDRGRQDTTPNLDDVFQFPMLPSGTTAAVKPKMPMQQA